MIVRPTGLYHASERHFARFGYAEYSLTFIPYILMSLINLLWSLCEPQNPSMYLPRHGTATGRGPRDGAALDDRLMWHPPGAIVELVEQQSAASLAAAKRAASDGAVAQAEFENNVSGAVGVVYDDRAVLDSEELSDADTTPVIHTCPSAGPDFCSFAGIEWLLCVIPTFFTIYRFTSFEQGENRPEQGS